MGIHILALAKLNLAATSAHGRAAPAVAALLGPFLFKLSLSLRPLHQTYAAIFRSSRLFVFQLARIVGSTGAGTVQARWDQALRLVSERVVRARRSDVSELEEDSLRNLSMLAL